jgi:murein DD-endopeptidase MepM/ murein hydrolase activator NlpD
MRRRVALLCALTVFFGLGAIAYRSLVRGPSAGALQPRSPSAAQQSSEAKESQPSQEPMDAPEIDDLALPLEGLKLSDIPDTFLQARPGGRVHEAADLMAPRGTPVYAVTDGVIRKLFLSKPGGNTIYQFDESEDFCFYYAHLDAYAEGLHEGQKVEQGDVIGYVGSTGNADPSAPHLHFAIFKLGPEKRWWEGTALNPYPILQEIARRND